MTLAVAVISLAVSGAWAGTLALNPFGGTDQPENAPFNLGWQFTVSSGAFLTVTELGYYDSGGDGLNFSHQVGIFDDATHNLLVSGTIDSGLTDPLEQSYRVVSASFILGSGVYDIVGFNPNGGGADNFYGGASSATPIGGLTFDTAVGSLSGSFGFTNVAQGGENIGIFGPNFFATTTVPEPGAFILAGFALAGLGLVARRRP
jgi:hypothetical protein